MTGNEVKAFEAIFKSHYVRLTLFANKFLNDLNASEEIGSEALTILWENRNNVAASSNITAYLYKIVQNKCMNYIKHQKVENEYVNYMIRHKLIGELPEYLADPLHEKEVAAQIKIAIDSLPVKCRLIFQMSRFEHLKNREIAERLNISVKTVERQITIALEKLRKNLKYLLVFVLLV
jgi:RNA polymerase sigma-70 factor (family 1)